MSPTLHAKPQCWLCGDPSTAQSLPAFACFADLRRVNVSANVGVMHEGASWRCGARAMPGGAPRSPGRDRPVRACTLHSPAGARRLRVKQTAAPGSHGNISSPWNPLHKKECQI
jgi:hypothetical protein